MGLLGIPALILLSQATALWQVVLLTCVLWFCGGVGTALAGVYVGLQVDEHRRGRSFGVLSLAMPLAAIASGTTVGQIIAAHGWPMMFVALAVVWAAWPVTALLGVKDQPAPTPRHEIRAPHVPATRLGRSFRMLVVVTLMAAVAASVGRFGASVSMQSLGFSPSDVASTTTVGGLAAMPVVLLAGLFSDRLGRKRFLMLGYVLAAGSALALTVAVQLWHFWLAAALTLMARSIGDAVASAFTADLLPAEERSRGIPWIKSTMWVAGAMSFLSAGYVMDALGPTVLYVVVAVLAVAAVLILRTLRPDHGRWWRREAGLGHRPRRSFERGRGLSRALGDGPSYC